MTFDIIGEFAFYVLAMNIIRLFYFLSSALDCCRGGGEDSPGRGRRRLSATSGLICSVLLAVQPDHVRGDDLPRSGASEEVGKVSAKATGTTKAHEPGSKTGDAAEGPSAPASTSKREPLRTERELGIDRGVHNDNLHNLRLFNTRVNMTRGVNPGVKILLESEYARFEDNANNWMGNPTAANEKNNPKNQRTEMKRFVSEIIGYSVRMDYLPQPPSAAILNPKVAEYFLKRDMSENPRIYFGNAADVEKADSLKSKKEQILFYKNVITDLDRIIKSPSRAAGRINQVLSQVPLHRPQALEDGTKITKVTIPLDRNRALKLVKDEALARRRVYEGVIAMRERQVAIEEVSARLDAEAAAASAEAAKKKPR